MKSEDCRPGLETFSILIHNLYKCVHDVKSCKLSAEMCATKWFNRGDTNKLVQINKEIINKNSYDSKIYLFLTHHIFDILIQDIIVEVLL